MAGHRRTAACRTRRRSALRVGSRHRKKGKPKRANCHIERKSGGLRGFPDRRSYRATVSPSDVAWWPNGHLTRHGCQGSSMRTIVQQKRTATRAPGTLATSTKDRIGDTVSRRRETQLAPPAGLEPATLCLEGVRSVSARNRGDRYLVTAQQRRQADARQSQTSEHLLTVGEPVALATLSE